MDPTVTRDCRLSELTPFGLRRNRDVQGATLSPQTQTVKPHMTAEGFRRPANKVQNEIRTALIFSVRWRRQLGPRAVPTVPLLCESAQGRPDADTAERAWPRNGAAAHSEKTRFEVMPRERRS